MTPAFYGSTGGIHLNQPIVGMAATPDGQGYWLVASDGGIFSFGDAAFYGSTGNIHLNQPIVGMAATPDGKGYWLVASDGGIFSFGDAAFYGSTGNIHLNQPIVGMAATPDGKGYWLVASDGGIFTFGDAGYFGSAPASDGHGDVVALAAASNGQGYWVAGGDGAIDAFGAAPSEGSMSGRDLNRPIVGFAASQRVFREWSLRRNSPSPPPLWRTLRWACPTGPAWSRRAATGPYSWTSTAGVLPPGLNLTSHGTIRASRVRRGSQPSPLGHRQYDACCAHGEGDPLHHGQRGTPDGSHEGPCPALSWAPRTGRR